LSGFETRCTKPSAGSSYLASHGLQLPTTHKAFVAKLLNHTNTNSLTSIIPTPPTVNLKAENMHM
jgi:hypothetical protein